jgi:hypothetical protein
MICIVEQDIRLGSSIEQDDENPQSGFVPCSWR